MISRWPTMTFSTSPRSAWNDAMNCSTRGSCVMRSPLGRGDGAGPHYYGPGASGPVAPAKCKPSAKASMRRTLAWTSRGRRDQRAVDRQIAFDFARRREFRGHARASRRAKPRAQRRIEDQALGQGVELGLVAEQQAGHVVLDQ